MKKPDKGTIIETGAVPVSQWAAAPVTADQVFSGLHIPEGIKGRWVLSHQVVRKGTKLQVNTLRDGITGGDPVFSIRAPKRTVFHTLREMTGKKPYDIERCRFWMSDHPSEVYSHVKHLRDFYGRVLVGGLGIGVAVNYLERHPLVHEIVVVEKSRDVISLVAPHLKTKKTTIIHMDLFKYLGRQLLFGDTKPREKGVTPHKFDWAFFDIWIPSGEHTFNTMVMPLRKLATPLVSKGNIRCWKEESMLGQIRMNAEIQIGMFQASQRMEGKIPGGHLDEAMREHIFKLSKEEFNHTREMLWFKWAFYRWCRESGASIEGMYEGLKLFMKALVDPELWDQHWAKWYEEPKDA